MIRPMTSGVSALSGIVAKGHQAIHFVSSAPSKIPYGGFSPVRLQTSCQQRPSLPLQTYTLPQFRSPPRAFYSVIGLAPGGTRGLDFIHSSSGPWLPVRFYCPVGSRLTMATSAPLSATRRLMSYSARLRVPLASRRGSPIYSANPFTPCRRPYPGGPSDCLQRCLHRRLCLRRISTGSTTTNPTTPNQVGSVTRLQRSLHATAWSVACPASARTFTTELSWARSPRTPSRL